LNLFFIWCTSRLCISGVLSTGLLIAFKLFIKRIADFFFDFLLGISSKRQTYVRKDEVFLLTISVAMKGNSIEKRINFGSTALPPLLHKALTEEKKKFGVAFNQTWNQIHFFSWKLLLWKCLKETNKDQKWWKTFNY
jgi:hypothetical protein